MEVNIKVLKKEIETALQQAGIENAAHEAALLLEDLCDMQRYDLVSGNKSISSKNAERIRKSVKKRCTGYPLQYILGKWEFMSLPFIVTEDTLIPRQDTETLCEFVINYLKSINSPKVLDLCCGTGCIGISVAHYIESAKITLVDSSEQALKVARENSRLNNVGSRIRIICDDALSPQSDDSGFDAIVCNPPYIPKSDIESLSKEVQHEPRTALDGGEDGLDFYHAICSNYINRLPNGGLLAVEVGIGQAETVKELFCNSELTNVSSVKDLCGIYRVIYGFKK